MQLFFTTRNLMTCSLHPRSPK